MRKAFAWLICSTVLACVVIWAVQTGVMPSNGHSATKKNQKNQSVDTGASMSLEAPASETTTRRVSPRYAEGALENYQREKSLDGLKRAIRDQEDKVEERRKVLATIIKTKGIIYRGDETSNDGDSPATRGVSDSVNSATYVDAKLEFETDQKLLEEMKLKLMEETIRLKGSGK